MIHSNKQKMTKYVHNRYIGIGFKHDIFSDLPGSFVALWWRVCCDFKVYALIRAKTPSGMITAKATPTKSPAPRTEIMCNFSSFNGINRGAEPAPYEPISMTNEKIINWPSPSMLKNFFKGRTLFWFNLPR